MSKKFKEFWKNKLNKAEVETMTSCNQCGKEVRTAEVGSSGLCLECRGVHKASHSQIEQEILRLVENSQLTEDQIIRQVAQKTGASTTEVARMMSALDF